MTYSDESTVPRRAFTKLPKHKNGRPTLPDEVKAIRKMDKDTFLSLLNETWDMGYNELNDFVRNKRGTVGEQFVAACMLNGIKYGDTNRLTAIVTHMIGKPKDEVDVTVTHEHVPIDRAKLIEAISNDPFIEVQHARLGTGKESISDDSHQTRSREEFTHTEPKDRS